MTTAPTDLPEQPPRRWRVAGVDDHPLMRDGLALLLPGCDVIATFPDIESLLAERPQVDVVILDLDLSGADEARVLHGGPGVQAVAAAGYRILIYTNERRGRVLYECLAAGADGVIHKAEPLQAVMAAIGDVARGHTVITTALIGLAEVLNERGELPSLTPRQSEVLAAKARGTSNKTIAERLHISERTIEHHVYKIGNAFTEYLRSHSHTDLERYLGQGEGDLLDRRGAPNVIHISPKRRRKRKNP